MKNVTVLQARDNMADLINSVSFGNERYVITRYGKKAAVLLSISEWNRIQKALDQSEEEYDAAAADEAYARVIEEEAVPYETYKRKVQLQDKARKASRKKLVKTTSKRSTKDRKGD